MGFVFLANKIAPVFGYGILALSFFINGFGCQAQLLPPDEVQTLQTISRKLELSRFWNNISDASCNRLNEDFNNTIIVESKIFHNVSCECSYENNTVCHINRIFLKGLNLTGVLPEEFGRLAYLEELSLFGNRLNGSIPEQIGNITTLRKLDLSFNNLTSQIPKEIENPTLLELTVTSSSLWKYGFCVSSFSFSFFPKSFFLVSTEDYKVASGASSIVIIELRALDVRKINSATGNFDPANKIGEGGFGPVYKGVLSDGGVIAVKQLSSKSKQGTREFVNEIGMISALQHPNLVRLFGCCTEGNQLLLIYEYMENNSLARALFGRDDNRMHLDWPTRKKILLGIARGLAYLHEESRLKIVHRDIKATNVLLDRDLNAKISDFGLAKLDEEEHTHIST
ncbi:putative LRR receptor-like serine/threonine-protein kinase [Morus notabilis]|uniref:non-specific serine/threonine protein kinase n=2 Tax=Morus notabilis TaxID=981085 RepID=W9RFY9_9ROSA|nr:putative LRR receptor-like serine/threonine-protein kinase [Morus notabilis]